MLADRLAQQCLQRRRKLCARDRVDLGEAQDRLTRLRELPRIERERAVHLHDVVELPNALDKIDQLWDALGGEWITTRVVDDGLDVVLARAREIREELVVPGARLLVQRQRAHVARREAQVKERRAREQDQRDHWNEHDERPAHHGCRDGVPPSAPARVRLEEREAQRFEARAEEHQKRGQECEAIEHGARDDDGAREAHRRQERALIEEHPRQSDRDGDAREGHRAAGGGHRDPDRVLGGATPAELLTEAARDEERVIDRDAQADERHDVLRVHRDVRDVREKEHARDPAHHRERADAERHERGDDRAEDEDKKDERERQGNDLSATEVVLQHRVEAVVDREDAGGLHAELVRRHLRAQI